jgi:hypothetical protein
MFEHLLSIGGSFIGALLAAQLAFNRFSREKVWERKAAAYTAIFEAMHTIRKWYEKHLEAAMLSRELDVPTVDRLHAEMKEAREQLALRLASETWLIPAHCRDRLNKMVNDLSSSHPESWEEYLDEGCSIIATATDDLRTAVESDLGLRDSWFRRHIRRALVRYFEPFAR